MERRRNILPTPSGRFLEIPSACSTRVLPGGSGQDPNHGSQHSMADWKNSLILGLPLRTRMLCQSQKPANIQRLFPLKST